MADESADKSGWIDRSADLAELLRTGQLGAFFSPSQAAAAGLTRQRLRTLVRRGRVERFGRGLYKVADAEPTENHSLAMACARVPNSIVCLLSALGVHQIGTQLPPAVWLAIPHRARVPHLAGVTLRVVRFSGAAWAYGVTDTAFEGVPARITSPARTIVDCFRYERLVGPEAAMEAFLDGLGRRDVTIAELDRVERVLPSRRLRAALDLSSTGAI